MWGNFATINCQNARCSCVTLFFGLDPDVPMKALPSIDTNRIEDEIMTKSQHFTMTSIQVLFRDEGIKQQTSKKTKTKKTQKRG